MKNEVASNSGLCRAPVTAGKLNTIEPAFKTQGEIEARHVIRLKFHPLYRGAEGSLLSPAKNFHRSVGGLYSQGSEP
jgi:hypothetical protein